MDTAIIYRGKKFDICSIIHNGRSYVVDFIDSIQANDQRKVFALLKRTANEGILVNDQKFHKLKGVDIWEFKSFQVRLFCFFNKERLIILTHGFIKKSNDTPRKEIEKAVKLQKEYVKNRGK